LQNPGIEDLAKRIIYFQRSLPVILSILHPKVFPPFVIINGHGDQGSAVKIMAMHVMDSLFKALYFMFILLPIVI